MFILNIYSENQFCSFETCLALKMILKIRTHGSRHARGESFEVLGYFIIIMIPLVATSNYFSPYK